MHMCMTNAVSNQQQLRIKSRDSRLTESHARLRREVRVEGGRDGHHALAVSVRRLRRLGDGPRVLLILAVTAQIVLAVDDECRLG